MEENLTLRKFIKDLEKKAKSDNIKRVLVGTVVLFNNKILLVERSPKDDFLPGYFEIPGGKLEKNEDIIQGVQRELREETGLKVKIVYDYAGSFDAVSPDGKKARQFNFLTKPTSNQVRLSKEHSRYIWWDIGDVELLSSLLMIKTVKVTLQKAVECIKKAPFTHHNE
jgi:8-oxo-dGTP diphosphatase